MLKRVLFFVYGAVCYLVFLAAFLYALGFVGGFLVPTTLDGAATMPFGRALAIDLGLLALFAVQHSTMARKGFKERWTRIVPAPIERSTYVLFSSAALALMFAFWQPLGGVVWEIASPAGRALAWTAFGFGWGLVLVATFLINHFDLFGLKQVWFHLRGRELQPPAFVTPGPYKLVRHPLYLGWLFAFWATPRMTGAHLVFAIMTTAYILVAIWLEERDLVREHGARYVGYRERTPMILPTLRSFARSRAGRLAGNASRAAFVFFLVKGLLWLLVPAALWLAS
jgi:protein-S-isoprenylcysteine O-methyltransferase Ste14